ncbi:hypothetical protein ABIB25_004571 [Nakamurella sp. UYEF19]|uniref:hypothetical protein n=1 Tax=Nakamurella sp. UYEF19 TaxID=1756392 RepID=UPI00339386F4
MTLPDPFTPARYATAPDVPATAPGGLPPLDGELFKARYGEQLAGWLADVAAETTRKAADVAAETTRKAVETALAAAREDADLTAETASLKGIEDAYIATTQASLDRSLTRVNIVTASVATVTTLYTGLLGLVYTADSSKGNNHLGAIALVPGLFLGLALFLVTIYAALIKASVTVGPLLPTGIGGQIPELRLITFMRWCFSGVLQRSWALHAGIVSFGVGVVTLPVSFIALTSAQQQLILFGGLALVIGTGLAGKFLRK